jgi:hypothetical protein
MKDTNHFRAAKGRTDWVKSDTPIKRGAKFMYLLDETVKQMNELYSYRK